MKKRDIFLIAGVFIVALITFLIITLMPKETMNKAHVYHDAKVYVTINFETKQYEYTELTNKELLISFSKEDAQLISYELPEGHDIIILHGSYSVKGVPSKVYIEIDWIKRRVRILHDDTPKQIGVNRDWYDGSGLPVISAPNKIYIEFEGSKKAPSDVDGEV